MKGREGRGERGKTSFLVKRSFHAFPASSHRIRNKKKELFPDGRRLFFCLDCGIVNLTFDVVEGRQYLRKHLFFTAHYSGEVEEIIRYPAKRQLVENDALTGRQQH